MTKKKKKNRLKQLKNSFLVKKLPIIIGTLLLTGILIFLIAYNSYQEAFKVDIDGYMIGSDSIEAIKNEEISKEEVKVGTVKLKSNDSVYKNTFDHYVDSEKKNTVNVDYPLYVNDGLTIINYNENINLLDTSFDRTTGYKNLVISYGKLYDNSNYTQIDKESYLFVSYQNGVFINLYDVKIETVANTYEIPTNSFLFFMEDQLNYFERTKKGFVKKSITDIDLDSMVTFYYTGGKEEYKYTYGDLIKKTGSVYIVEEIPPAEITPDEPEIEDAPAEPVLPEEPTPPEDVEPSDPEDIEWQKPVVNSSELTGNVYSISGSIEIVDPAKTITKAPTYTLYVNNKVSTRRTYYTSGNIMITGLKSETEYVIVGQYTYLDKDGETKKIVTFYTGIVTTKDRSSLEPVEVSFEKGAIYAKKVELNKVKITSSLESESINGINKIGFIANGEKYMVNTRNVQTILAGGEITIQTGENLPSNSDIPFEIVFYDKDGYEIPTDKNTGKTITCKQQPTVLLRQQEGDNVSVNVKIDLKNDDNVILNNYHYVVTDQIGKIVASGLITGEKLSVKNLDSNQVFKLEILADYDVGDGRGIVLNNKLGELEFSTLPIDSLGFLYVKTTPEDVTSDSAKIVIEANNVKTSEILLQLINRVEISLYEADTEEFVAKKELIGNDIIEFAAGQYKTINFTDLDSNKEYKIKVDAFVVVGTQTYDITGVPTNDKFETRKIAAITNIKNQFVTNTMVDFDVQIYDIDRSIISGEVVLELRDSDNKLINTQVLKTSTTKYERLTYKDLEPEQNYTIKFIANQYNETNDNSQYHAKYKIYEMNIYTDEGITGEIELVSSTRKPKGRNLIDITSDINWYETEQYYTVPKTIDEEGNLHIYSKSSSSSYSYDLSEYEGRYVIVTFKIKAITPTQSGAVYVSQWISGTTSTTYGQRIDGITTTGWKTVERSFLVGSYASTNSFIKIGDTTYGKKKGSFLNFYISGGTSVLSEYVIKDLHVEFSDETPEKVNHDAKIEMGTYNTSRGKGNSDTVARTSKPIRLQGGHYYEFKSNVDQIIVHMYNPTTGVRDTSYTYNNSWTIPGHSFYISGDRDAYVQFRYTENGKAVDPNEVEFSINKLTKINKSNIEPEPYIYDLETKVKVSVSDLREEITNRDYFIKVYENNVEVKSYNYIELEGKTKIENVIKKIDVEEGKKYRVEVGVLVRDRYYALHDFELSTKGEVRGISTINDWAFIQPRGNYILLNDIYFEREAPKKVGWGNRYFYGSIDFQGYTIKLHDTPTGEGLRIFDRIEKTAVLKNLVLDIHYDQTERKTYTQSFINNNYGTVENININIYNETPSHLTNTTMNPLAYTNQRTGVIRNFVIQVVNEMNFYYNSSLLVRTNHGLVENGYVYGKDIIVDPLYTSSTWSYLSLVQVHGGTRSILQNVYVLPSLKFPSGANSISGLLSFETYGKVRNSYIIGNGNTNVLSSGPTVGVIQGIAELKNVYYKSSYSYSKSQSQKINATALNDLYFQQSTLGSGFNVEELLGLGYYPQINYTSTTMPQQPYLELPEIEKDNKVDIISMEIEEESKTNNSAVVVFNVSNPYGDTVSEIEIEDLTVQILGQTYDEGKSYVTVQLSNPQLFKSKYAIRQISSVDYMGNINTREYPLGEKYAEVDFYKEIRTTQQFLDIKKSLTQNYILMEDISLEGISNPNIGNFSGTLDGNGHKVIRTNIQSNVNGIFNQMNGTLKNITFDDFTQNTNTSYFGLVGSSNMYAKYENVHLTNVTIHVPSTKTSDTIYAGALVGNITQGKIQDCSVSNIEIKLNNYITNVAIGGLVGYSNQANISNSFAQDVNIEVNRVMSVYGVGGLVGRQVSSNAIISNVYTTGKIYNEYLFTGGIVGYSEGSVEQSYSSVNVSSRLGYTSGIVGYATNANTAYDKNVYYGNIYTEKTTKKIIGNNTSTATNYSLASSLVNGYPNALEGGETVLSLEDITNPVVYEETILLGESYDYSKLPEKILPKLYYSGSEELMPYQNDNKIHSSKLEIIDVNIISGSHTEDSVTLKIDVKNPDAVEIKSIKIDDMKQKTGTSTSIINTTDDNGNPMTTITVTMSPEKYFDGYKLSEIAYEEDGIAGTVNPECRIQAAFYKSITSYDDWQNISTEIAENYYLRTDLDFTGKNDVNMGVLINRLETVSDSEVKTIKGLNITNTTNKHGVSLIKRLYTKLDNINFENFTINDTTKSTNSYVTIIQYNYADITDVNFKNISFNAPYENYVAPIGNNYGFKIENITITDIDMYGNNYVAGLVANGKNAEGRTYKNIRAYVEDQYKDEDGKVKEEHADKKINIKARASYAGGIFGHMDIEHGSSTFFVDNITAEHVNVKGESTSSTYIGGIGGIADCNNCIITDSVIDGGRYVGGVFGYMRNAYGQNITARNLTITGDEYYIGGITGYSKYLYTALIEDSTVEIIGTGGNSYGVGGISGYTSGYTMRNLGVNNVKITSKNGEAGGLIGRFSGGNVYASYVQDCTIKSLNKAGGMYGVQNGSWGWSNQIRVTNSTVVAENSMAGGISGDFGNAENAHSYMKEMQISNTQIKAKSLVGGFMGSLRYKPYLPQSIYGLYFEGKVESTEGTAGLATGDQYNAYFLSFNRIVVHEKAIAKEGGSESYTALDKAEYNEINNNMLDGISLKQGYYLNGSGVETSSISYPNASYTEQFITLEAGNTYRIGLKTTGSSSSNGTDWFRIVLYNTDEEFLAHVTTDSDTVRKYIDRHFNMTGATEVRINALRNCKIKIMYYNMNLLTSYYMYRGNYGTYGMDPLQVVDSTQLRNPITWTRYMNSSKTPDFYHSSLLIHNYDYFNWSKLGGNVTTMTVSDKSVNRNNGTLTASATNKYGASFDGLDDKFVVDNYVTKGQNFTISTNVTLPYIDNNRVYQFIFSSEDFSQTNNGFGLFIGQNRRLWIRIMGAHYDTYYNVPTNTPVDITVTYDGSKFRTYINGDKLPTDVTPANNKKTIVHKSTARVTISHEYNYSNAIRRYNGITKYLTLYERTLNDNEVKNNYVNQTVDNDAEGLRFYFDFTDLAYTSSVGYYPTVKDGGLSQTDPVKLPPSKQKDIEFPTSTNRNYPTVTGSKSATSSNINLLNRRISEIYKVYPSGVNTVNIEFTDVYDDVSFKYSNGKNSSEFIKTEDRVYTLRYDYKNDFNLTLKSSADHIDVTIPKEDLARTIGIVDNSYYYIKNGELYENDEKLNIKARNISGNLVLINDKEVYDIISGKVSKPIFGSGVLNTQTPLYEYMIDNTYIKTYYGFTKITDINGNTVIRDGQIMVKDGKMFIFNNNDDVNQTMQVFTNYNTSDYQISLSQNKLISIKEEIKFPTYFSNSNIIEINQDNQNSEPIIIIKYKDGYICAFDYYSGEIKFSSGSKPEVSLTKYMIESISNKYVLSSSNSSYKETIKLKDKILNVSDKEVKDKLVVGTISGSGNNGASDIELPEGALAGGNGQALTDQYIQVYNYQTGKYEIYSTKDLLNAEEKVITSTETKIYKDEFLYNYFYGNKVNRFIEKNRVLIIFTIIALIIINLIIFSKYVTKKEATKA